MILNSVNCTSAFSNTGFGKCNFIPREIVAALIVSSAFVITETDAQNLQTFLDTQLKNPVKSQRVLLVPGFVGITDSSDEVVRETLGYGGTQTLRDGNYNWTMRFVNGGLCLLTSLQSMNGQVPNVIFIDAAGNLIGTKKANGLGGIPLEDYWANKWTPSDGSSVSANLSVYFSFKPHYINERLSFIQTTGMDDFDISMLTGYQDLVISTVSATAGSAIVNVADKCSGDSAGIGELYGNDLADPELWSAVGFDGTEQVISAVAYNDANNRYTLTFLPVRTVGSIVNLASVTDLEAAGVEGFEGVASRVPLVVA